MPHENQPRLWTSTYPTTGESFMLTDYLTTEQIVTLRDQPENGVRRALMIPFNASVPPIAL